MSLNHDLFAVQHVSSIDAGYYSSIMPKKEGKESLTSRLSNRACDAVRGLLSLP